MDAEQHHGHEVEEVEADVDLSAEEGASMTHDSMVTVRLSEPPPPAPPSLTLNTSVPNHSDLKSAVTNDDDIETADTTSVPPPDNTLDDVQEEQEEEEQEESPRITMMDPNGNESPMESAMGPGRESRRGSDSSEEVSEGEQVNWEELEKTEEQEPRNEASDDVSS